MSKPAHECTSTKVGYSREFIHTRHMYNRSMSESNYRPAYRRGVFHKLKKRSSYISRALQSGDLSPEEMGEREFGPLLNSNWLSYTFFLFYLSQLTVSWSPKFSCAAAVRAVFGFRWKKISRKKNLACIEYLNKIYLHLYQTDIIKDTFTCVLKIIFSLWTLKPQSDGSALSPSAMSFYASIAEVTDAYQIPSNKYLPSLKIHIFLQHDLCLLASTRTLVINWCHGIHKYL